MLPATPDLTDHYESNPWAMLQLFMPGVFGDGSSKNPRAAAISAVFRAIDDKQAQFGTKGSIWLLEGTFGKARLASLLGVTENEVAKWLEGAPVLDRYIDGVPGARPFGLFAKIEELCHVRLAVYALVDDDSGQGRPGRLDRPGARVACGQSPAEWAATRAAVHALATPSQPHYEWHYKAAMLPVELAVDIETQGALRRTEKGTHNRQHLSYDTHADFCEAARRCNAFRIERGLRPFDFTADLDRVLDRLGVLGDTMNDVGAKYRHDLRDPDAWVQDRHGPPAPRWWHTPDGTPCKETPYGLARQSWLYHNRAPTQKKLMDDAARLADEVAGWRLGPAGDSLSGFANKFFIQL